MDDEAEIKEGTTKTAPASDAPKAKLVTSSKTIDFPSLDWGITAGQTRELPADLSAQDIILSSPFISITK